MIGEDTTFLVQLELIKAPAHHAAHQLLQREILQPQVSLALAPRVLAFPGLFKSLAWTANPLRRAGIGLSLGSSNAPQSVAWSAGFAIHARLT